jgi:hypothetical protein
MSNFSSRRVKHASLGGVLCLFGLALSARNDSVRSRQAATLRPIGGFGMIACGCVGLLLPLLCVW